MIAAGRSLAAALMSGPGASDSSRTFSSSRSAADGGAGPGPGSSGGRGAAPAGATPPGASAPAAAKAAASALSAAQQAALASLVLSSFKRDPGGAAGVLSRALDDGGKRELLAVLSAGLPESPELSR